MNVGYTTEFENEKAMKEGCVLLCWKKEGRKEGRNEESIDDR
jgi:hypothetical protein